VDVNFSHGCFPLRGSLSHSIFGSALADVQRDTIAERERIRRVERSRGSLSVGVGVVILILGTKYINWHILIALL
jgi:hypothetical protein